MFGSDRITSATYVLGKREILDQQTHRSSRWPFAVQIRSFIYKSDASHDDVEQYMDYLQKNDWILSSEYRELAVDKDIKLAALSKDEGYVLVICLRYHFLYFTVEITKEQGDLTGYTGIWNIE